MVAILSNQREVIFDAVMRMYTDVATKPEHVFHFPTGRGACEFVGYPPGQLDAVPDSAVESFAGVGYPFAAEVIRQGDTVLDLGSGSGTDTLIASGLVGPSGRVIGLDMTEAMRQKLPDSSVDVVTSNGVLNLVPDKVRAIREIARVLRPGGRLQLADIVVETLPSEACRSHPELWAECVVGATRADAYFAAFAEAGLIGMEELTRLDYFAGSSSAETQKVAGSFGAHSIVLRGRKG